MRRAFLIEESARRLTATLKGAVVMQPDIALGFAADGNKVRGGDGNTPEGIFAVNRDNPQSAFHLSIGIDYPQPKGIALARQ